MEKSNALERITKVLSDSMDKVDTKLFKEEQIPKTKSGNGCLISLFVIIVIILGLILPFHYNLTDNSKGDVMFPKDNLTFKYTFITEDEVSEIIQHYNDASFFEKAAMENNGIIRILTEHHVIIDDTDNQDNNSPGRKYRLNIKRAIDRLLIK